MPTRYLEHVNPKSPLAKWAWGPVIMLRMMLVATYLGYVYAALVGLIIGIPILDFTTLPGYHAPWSILLGISAVVAGIGSLTDRWQKTERWASMVLSALTLTYIVGLNLAAWAENDGDRAFVGAIAIIAGIPPIARYIYLAAQSGKIHVATPRGG